MAKPDRRNLKTPSHLTGLIRAGHLDLERFLNDRDNTTISSNYHRPLVILSYVSSELDSAVCTSNFLRYSALRQVEALLKKNTDLPGTDARVRKDAAMSTFFRSEKICRITNRRLRHYRNRSSRMPKSISRVMGLAQSISNEIFGPMSRLTFHKVCEQSGFGPGFNFGSTEQEHRHLYYKVAGPHTVTAEALPYAKVLLNHSEHWKQSLCDEGSTFKYVRGNRVTSVPKTAVTDRTIAIEPSLNVFIQKGVDSVLKGRLRHFGVNLTNQDRNRLPAKIGSQRPLHAATVDLSMASDCISREIVQWLVPHLWYVLLDDLRSKEYTLDKGETWSEYEKFSSMGNAFTFPLETIIFYSLAKACTIEAGGDLSVLRVYGDDIIIDPRAVLLLYEVLKFTGFTPNVDKSYAFGYFRETCGTDFLSGVDTRPVYVKRCPKNDQEVYNLFNRLLRHRVGFHFHNLCEYLYKLVRRPFIGPPDLPAGENFHRWYAGKSVMFDHYFHAPPDMGERFKRYDLDLQRIVWKFQIVRFAPRKMDTSNWTLQMWYLTFLLGLPGTKHVDSVSRFRRITPTEVFYRWDALPWRPAFFDCLGNSQT